MKFHRAFPAALALALAVSASAAAQGVTGGSFGVSIKIIDASATCRLSGSPGVLAVLWDAERRESVAGVPFDVQCGGARWRSATAAIGLREPTSAATAGCPGGTSLRFAGVVRDSDEGAPVARARVRIDYKGRTLSAITNGAGAFDAHFADCARVQP